MNLLALDPGITTGYTLAVSDGRRLFLAVGEEKMGHAEFYSFMLHIPAKHIICESFEFRQNKNPDNIILYSCELIGILKLHTDPDTRMRPATLHMQTAAEGKGHFTNDRLKELGVYPKGLEHGRDSLRHMLQWIVFGYGFQYGIHTAAMELVEEQWIRDAYFM